MHAFRRTLTYRPDNLLLGHVLALEAQWWGKAQEELVEAVQLDQHCGIRVKIGPRTLEHREVVHLDQPTILIGSIKACTRIKQVPSIKEGNCVSLGGAGVERRRTVEDHSDEKVDEDKRDEELEGDDIRVDGHSAAAIDRPAAGKVVEATGGRVIGWIGVAARWCFRHVASEVREALPRRETQERQHGHPEAFEAVHTTTVCGMMVRLSVQLASRRM